MGDAERRALMALWQAGKKQWGNDHSAFRVDLQGIHRVVHFITENLLEEEELFTSIESSVEYAKSNDGAVFRKLVSAIKSDDKAVLKKLLPQTDPYTVAASLKGYFADMPEPIIQFGQYERYIEIAKETRGASESVKVRKLSKALSELPKPRYANLRSIAALCMNLDDALGDLAVVFAPSILHPRNPIKDPNEATENPKLVLATVLNLFNLHEKLFVKGGGGSPNTWKPKPKPKPTIKSSPAPIGGSAKIRAKPLRKAAQFSQKLKPKAGRWGVIKGKGQVPLQKSQKKPQPQKEVVKTTLSKAKPRSHKAAASEGKKTNLKKTGPPVDKADAKGWYLHYLSVHGNPPTAMGLRSFAKNQIPYKAAREVVANPPQEPQITSVTAAIAADAHQPPKEAEPPTEMEKGAEPEPAQLLPETVGMAKESSDIGSSAGVGTKAAKEEEEGLPLEGNFYRCVSDFKAESEGELSVVANVIVTLDDIKDGWAFATLESGETGWVPSSFFEQCPRPASWPSELLELQQVDLLEEEEDDGFDESAPAPANMDLEQLNMLAQLERQRKAQEEAAARAMQAKKRAEDELRKLEERAKAVAAEKEKMEERKRAAEEKAKKEAERREQERIAAEDREREEREARETAERELQLTREKAERERLEKERLEKERREREEKERQERLRKEALEAKRREEEERRRVQAIKDEERRAKEEAERKRKEEARIQRLREEEEKRRREEKVRKAKEAEEHRRREEQEKERLRKEEEQRRRAEELKKQREAAEAEQRRLAELEKKKQKEERRRLEEESRRQEQEKRRLQEEIRRREEQAARLQKEKEARQLEEKRRAEAEAAEAKAAEEREKERRKNLKVKSGGKKKGDKFGAMTSMWDTKTSKAQKELRSNVFSKHYEGSGGGLRKGDKGYGQAPEGSKSAARSKRANEWVKEQVGILLGVIRRIGAKNSGGFFETRFGPLFIAYQDISDTLVGILKRARKYKCVNFEGDMLWQGSSNHVAITLTEKADIWGWGADGKKKA